MHVPEKEDQEAVQQEQRLPSAPRSETVQRPVDYSAESAQWSCSEAASGPCSSETVLYVLLFELELIITVFAARPAHSLRSVTIALGATAASVMLIGASHIIAHEHIT